MAATQEEAVLVVDDDEDFLRSFANLLKVNKIAVLTVSSGDEALKILQTNPTITIVVSDQRMMGMKGTELLTIIAKNYPKVVRVLISGYTDFEPTVEAFNKAGAKTFIHKTSDDEEKIRAINEALKFQKELLELEDARERRKQRPVPRELPEHPKILLVARDTTGYGTFFTLIKNMEYPIRVMFQERFREYKYNANDYNVIFIDADQVKVDEIPAKPKELATYPYIVLIATDPATLQDKMKENGFTYCLAKEQLSYASSIGDFLLDLPFIGTSVFDKPLFPEGPKD